MAATEAPALIRSDLPIARGQPAATPGSGHGGHDHEGEGHDHDETGLGAPVLEPSAATKDEIRRRRQGLLRFWIILGAASAAFAPLLWLQDLTAQQRVPLAALFVAVGLFIAVRGYVQFCRVNLLTIYEKGIAPPFKPRATFDSSMDFHVPFSDFARIEVEDNDIERKELAEQVYFRFVFHYGDGHRLEMGPAILGRDPSKAQLAAFYDTLKEALGKSVPDKVELRKVFPDGRRPAVSVSARSLRLRVGQQVKEFPWERILKLRIKPARSGSSGNFDKFDVQLEGGWVHLDAALIPTIRRTDALTFLEEILRISRARKVEILQE